MRLQAAAIVIALTLAGCSDSGGETVDDGPDVKTGSDVGAISGVVVSEAVVPIPEAQVTVDDVTVTTDGEGVFVFEDLDPGTYFVSVSAEEYLSVQSSVDIEAGKVAKMRLLLPIDPTPKPYHQTQQFDGRITVSTGIVGWVYDYYAASTTGVPACTKCDFEFEADPEIHTMLFEAVWEDTINPGPYGPTYYWLDFFGPDGDDGIYVTSPAREELLADSFGGSGDYEMRFSPDDVWPAIEQEYTIFMTLFYLEGPPDDWRLIEE